MIELFFVFFLLIIGSEASASSRNSFLLLEDTALMFKDTMEPKLGEHQLIVVLESQDPKVNAELTKHESSLTIKVWGGMLNHRFISDETLLLLLCHEIGHYLGGPPTKAKGGWSSTEGQADYYSSFQCARDVGLDEVSFYESALNLTRIYASATFSAFEGIGMDISTMPSSLIILKESLSLGSLTKRLRTVSTSSFFMLRCLFVIRISL